MYLFEQKVPLVVMKHSNFGQDICFNGKIFFLVFHKSLPLWQNILIVDKIFFHGKIFLFFREEEKSFLLWQNILILDKIFIDGDPPRLPSQATKHQTEASSHLELNRKQIDLTS